MDCDFGLSIRRQISYLVVRARCVSACDLAGGVRTEPSFDSGGALLRKVVAVNGLSIPVTASSFRAPTCRVAEGMTEGGATEPSFDVGGTALQEVVVVNGPCRS